MEVFFRYQESRNGIGIILEIPINIYVRLCKYFTQYATTFTSIAQIRKNEYFFKELSEKGAPTIEALKFYFHCGCPSIKIEVTEPLMFYA